MSINFRLTVIGRMIQRDKEKLVETIKEVLEEEELSKQSYKKWETDMKALSEIFDHDLEELKTLIPNLVR